MADKLAVAVGRRALKNHGTKKNKQYDLANYYDKSEMRHGLPTGKTTEAKKDLEYYKKLGIPKHDAEILIKVKRYARRLDSGIPGIRIGYSSIIGFFPGVGDFADLILGYVFIIHHAKKVSKGKDVTGLKITLYRNLLVAFGVDLFPVVGDIADIFFRANTRNARALETMLLARLDATPDEKETQQKAGAAIPRRRAQTHPYYTEDDLAPELPPRYTDNEYRRRQGSARSYPAVAGPGRTKSGGWLSRFGSGGAKKRRFDPVEDVAPMRPLRPEQRLHDGQF